MKTGKYLIIIFLALGLCSCEKDTAKSDERPAFSYTEEIIHPPDEFLVIFDNLSVGQKTATVTFDSIGVWQVERIGDSRQSISLKNTAEVVYSINVVDSLGLAANSKYQIIVNGMLYGENRNLYVGFKRINLDYRVFEPKF